MNKDQLKKNVGSCVRLDPPVRRTDGSEADYDWVIQSADYAGITIRTHTGHQVILSYDQIKEFREDPLRDTDGVKHGFLHLKVRLHFTAEGSVRVAGPLWK